MLDFHPFEACSIILLLYISKIQSYIYEPCEIYNYIAIGVCRMKRRIYLPVIHEHPYFCFPESVGWYTKHPNHRVQRESGELDNYNLHVVIGGKGYLVADGTTYTLQQGDAFLYFPLQEQHYYADSEDPWEVLWIHFNGRHIKELFVERGFHRTHVWTLKQWKHLHTSILSLLEEVEQYTILHPSVLSTLTYGIIAEFITQAIPLTPNKGYGLLDRVMGILPQMQELSGNPFDLQAWADRIGISKYYFCRIFKQAAGMAPTDFIKLCRLQKAKQLLLEKGDWTVKQVSLEVGYPSVSYFGRLFRENEGVSPEGYRGKHAGDVSLWEVSPSKD